MNFIEYIQSTVVIGNENFVNQQLEWLFWILIGFNVVVLAIVRTTQPGYLAVLFRTGFYNRQIYQNTQELLRLNSIGSYLLVLAYIVSITLLVVSFLPFHSNVFTLTILGGSVIYVLLKYLAIKSIAFVSEISDGLTEHWWNHLIFFQITALVITPLMVFTHYLDATIQPYIHYSLAFLVMIIVLIREYQSILRSFQQRLPIIYIILYLCTLELIPLVVFIKVLIR